MIDSYGYLFLQSTVQMLRRRRLHRLRPIGRLDDRNFRSDPGDTRRVLQGPPYRKHSLRLRLCNIL